MKRKMRFLLAGQFLCQTLFVSDGKGACLSGIWLLYYLVIMGVSCRTGDSCVKKIESWFNFFKNYLL